MADLPADSVDARVEGAIRRALAVDRPETGAPMTLLARVEAIPASSGLGLLAWLTPRSIAGLALVGCIGAVLIATLATGLGSWLGIQHAGAPTPTTAPSFDPTVLGLGIRSSVLPTLQLVPAMVAIAAAGMALWMGARWFRAREMRRRGVVALVLAAVAVGAVALSQHPGFEWGGGSYGPVLGYGVNLQSPGSQNVETMYETAAAGAPIGVMVDLTNPGPLPISLEGLVVPYPALSGGPGWTSLWLVTDPTRYPNPLDNLVPFHPVVVPPDGFVTLYLIGKAGPCAYGPTFTIGASGVSGYLSQGRDIELAYSVYGLEREAGFTLPFELVEPLRDGCVG